MRDRATTTQEEPRLLTTADGSPTLYLPGRQVTYHSRDGAVGESLHVFLGAGQLIERMAARQEALQVLEVGYGTGLNAFLTLLMAGDAAGGRLRYIAFEPYPLPPALLRSYYQALAAAWPQLQAHYPGLPGFDTTLSERIQEEATLATAQQLQLSLAKASFPGAGQQAEQYDLIYYDAFAPAADPSLWAAEPLQAAAARLRPGGSLVTYSITGRAKQLLRQAGLTIERRPGFGQKRQMLRATRPPSES